jgi:hypothetical protein
MRDKAKQDATQDAKAVEGKCAGMKMEQSALPTAPAK